MADWPPMKPVIRQHEKENTYLTLVDMFVDVVEPSIIQMILQDKNWDLDAALEDIMILASASHVDKSLQKTNESPSSLRAIQSSQRKSSSNCVNSSLVNSVNTPREQPSSHDKTPFQSGKKNSKPHMSNTSLNFKDPSNTKPPALLPFLEHYNYIKSIPVSYDRVVMLSKDGVKLMVILRGPPGSGKSHLARKLLNDAGVSLPQHKKHIFSTDDFFVQNNIYLFVHELLNEAHMWNQRNVATALREQVSPIVVDNTNTQAWEMRVYVEMAVSGGYDIEILEPVTWWGFKEGELAKKNVHGVPKASIRNMIERYERGLTPEMLLQKFNLRYSLSSAPPQPVHKSKWKDKLSNQTNNKPKKKKKDSIKKTDSLDNCINDSFTTFPSNSVGLCQASNIQYPLQHSEKVPTQKGKTINLKSSNQSNGNYLSKQTNDQHFLINHDGKLINNASNSFLDFDCNSKPLLQNCNPFMDNYVKQKNEYDFKTISQLDHIEKHGYDNLKRDSSKNTFDFMAETKKMLAALGTSHGTTYRNKEQESEILGESNVSKEGCYNEDRKSDTQAQANVSKEDCSNENREYTERESKVSKEGCSNEDRESYTQVEINFSKGHYSNEDRESDSQEESKVSKENFSNQGSDEMKNFTNGIIGSVIKKPTVNQYMVNKLKDKMKSSTSLPERNEDEWEYVLVNSNGTFTYKRANSDPLTSNFVDKVDTFYQQHSGVTLTDPNSRLSNDDRNTSKDCNIEQHIFQNEDFEISRSCSLLNVSANSSKICQKEVIENNLLKNVSTMFQNCANNSTEERNGDHITSNITDAFELFGENSYKTKTEHSQKDPILFTEKSPNGFLFCNVNSTNSKQQDTINYFNENKVEALNSNKSVLKLGNCTQSELRIPEKLIDDVTCKDYNNILINKEMPYDDNHVNNLVLTNEFMRDEVNSNTSNPTKVLSLFCEGALGKSNDLCTQHEEDSSAHSDDDTVCAKDKKREDLITNFDQPNVESKVYGSEEGEISEEECKIHEDSSINKTTIKDKPNENSTNENRAVVLEMMKDILKSLAPLSSDSPETSTSDLKIPNDVEEKGVDSTESDSNTLNVPSTSIICNWDNGECWLPENKDSNSTEIRQPKPARNTSRPKVQAFSSTSQFEPKETASSFMMWDTVSNPLEHWDTLKHDCVVVKEKPIILSQRVKLSYKKLANCSTNTNYQDFSLIKEAETTGAKIIIGNPRNITEGICDLKPDVSEISETLHLEKSTMTNANFSGPVNCYDIAQISNLFPNIHKKYIFDMVEKCHGDINWAVDLLLDSEHSIYEQSDNNSDEEISAGNISNEDDNSNELEQSHCTSMIASYLVPDYEVGNESVKVNQHEQSRIKQMIENSVVIGKEHYSEKVLKMLKKKRPEYLNLIESSHPQINKQSDEVESALSGNVCNTEKTNIDEEMSDEVSSGSCETENEDDNYFDVVVNNDLILQLQQKFGNSNFPKLMDMTPVVKLPVSLARQLYGYIMDTLQTELDEKQDVIENMISQDEEIARILQSQDENFKPLLQEIMDMEVALEVHRADQEEMKEKRKPTVAATLSKNILLEKFPQVDPKVLMDVFHAHNFSLHDTMASLQLALGVQAAQSPKALVSTNSQDQIKEVGGGFAEELDLTEEAQAHRDQAACYYSLRMDCLNKAHEAFRSGNKPVASYYSQLAQMHKDKIAHCNSQAAACLMSSHTRGSNTLDLHFLHVTEAQVVLDMFLDETITQVIAKKKKHQTVYLITGRGLRSVGGVSRIKPMVLKTLNAREILFNDVNPGMICAILRATTPLSNSL